MSKDLNIRVGDVVRLKPLTVRFADSGEVTFKEQDREGYFSADLIEEIISRAETDAEKIARLEAELAKTPRRIEWGGGKCPVDPDTTVAVWLRGGWISSREAESFEWHHTGIEGDASDIIAYMVLPE